MGQYKSQYTGPQIDAGVSAALNPDLVPTEGSDALITSDAVAKVQQGFAPIETAATAANSYAIGDLLVWGGVLYKAKTSITAGDSFVVDTNIEATTIADKLDNIDTEITSNTDTTLTGLLTGNGSKVGTKSLDTSSLTNDADHVPVSSVVKSALDAKADKNDLATIHQTSPTCTETNGIAAGVFFYLDNELVVAKTAVANGATFTNGTNYESPTAGGLNALKSAIDAIDVLSLAKAQNLTQPNLNTYRTTGLYYVYNVTNAPSAWGFLIVINGKFLDSNDCLQIFIKNATDGKIYHRTMHVGSWSQWYSV